MLGRLFEKTKKQQDKSETTNQSQKHKKHVQSKTVEGKQTKKQKGRSKLFLSDPPKRESVRYSGTGLNIQDDDAEDPQAAKINELGKAIDGIKGTALEEARKEVNNITGDTPSLPEIQNEAAALAAKPNEFKKTKPKQNEKVSCWNAVFCCFTSRKHKPSDETTSLLKDDALERRRIT